MDSVRESVFAHFFIADEHPYSKNAIGDKYHAYGSSVIRYKCRERFCKDEKETSQNIDRYHCKAEIKKDFA